MWIYKEHQHKLRNKLDMFGITTKYAQIQTNANERKQMQINKQTTNNNQTTSAGGILGVRKQIGVQQIDVLKQQICFLKTQICFFINKFVFIFNKSVKNKSMR